jgi:hypothetical protein
MEEVVIGGKPGRVLLGISAEDPYYLSEDGWCVRIVFRGTDSVDLMFKPSKFPFLFLPSQHLVGTTTVPTFDLRLPPSPFLHPKKGSRCGGHSHEREILKEKNL